MATSDHAKALFAGEEGAAWDCRHCLLPSVDQVRINLQGSQLYNRYHMIKDKTWSGVGNGPRPRIPFSDWRWTVMVGGMKLEASMGIPMPRLAYLNL